MIHVLVAGNMVGYVVGLDGLSQLGKLYMDDPGSAMKFFGITMAMMSAAAHLGFEQRAREDEAKAKARIGGAEVEGVGTVVAGRRKGGKKEGRGTAGDEAPAGDSDAGDGGR
jgi:hypothetical protein